MSARRRYLPQPPVWEVEEFPRDDDGKSWLIIYLDVMTLMLSVFVLMLAYSTYSPEEYKVLTKSLSQPVAVQGEVDDVIEEKLQREETRAAIEEPAEVETDDLQEQYRQALLDQDLEESVDVTITSNQINLQIRERILFDLGRADLTPGGESVLSRLVPLLSRGGHAISVEGHTDTVPISNVRFPSNWELSTQRATIVLRFLIAQGVESARLRAIGYADTRPLADNDTEEGRSRNRRVSLVVHLSEE
jgi:chemotaxis protein MotB